MQCALFKPSFKEYSLKYLYTYQSMLAVQSAYNFVHAPAVWSNRLQVLGTLTNLWAFKQAVTYSFRGLLQ